MTIEVRNIIKQFGAFKALDNVDLVELVADPVRFSDGRDNNWQSPPAVTDYL